MQRELRRLVGGVSSLHLLGPHRPPRQARDESRKIEPDSGDLPAPSRTALASRAPRIVLRFDEQRNAAAIRALLDPQEFRLESAMGTFTAVAAHPTPAVHVSPRRTAFRTARIFRERGSANDFALLPQHGGLDLESLSLT